MVRIVTESTADIPADIADEMGITVVPSYVTFGAETYRDGVELTREQFYQRLASSPTVPKTATPPPAVYESVYRRLGEKADGIVSIHLAGQLSGLYSAAAVAAASISDPPIAVIDSGQVSMGYGWMAVEAAEAAQRGEPLEQIVALVQDLKVRSRVLATLNTLEFLHRGGRVGWAPAMVGALLQIKPLVEVRMGQVRLLQRTRSWKASLARMMESIQALGPLQRAIVLHTNAPASAEWVADRLQAAHPSWRRLIGQAGVTIASHAGPGAVGLACVTAAP